MLFTFNYIYQLQRLADKWREDYNFNHPHKPLGNESPKEYKPRFDEELFIEFRGVLKWESLQRKP